MYFLANFEGKKIFNCKYVFSFVAHGGLIVRVLDLIDL